MKIHFILLIIFLLILTSCKTEGIDDRLYNKEDILYLKEDNQSVKLAKDMELLNNSDKVVSSSQQFTKVLSFVPNDEYLQYKTIHGDEVSYLKLPKSKSTISGKLVYENNTKENIIVRAIFLQGNKNLKIKPTNSSKWVPSIQFNVPSHTSATINIDLNWDKNGMQELTFFPLEKTSDVYRYNGSILASYRFFVQSKDISINNEMLQEQTFNVEQKKFASKQNFFPEPSWVGGNNDELEYLIKKDIPLTNKKIKGLKFDEVPYNTTIDLLLVDEFGNTNLIAKNIKVRKNEVTFYEIDQNYLSKMYKKSTRQFLLIMNNREERIIADLKTIELNKKPFPTSFQRVIEFYKSNNQN